MDALTWDNACSAITNMPKQACYMRFRSITPLLLLCQAASADAPTQTARADAHAPIGVMADHLHHGDEWMVGYRFMRSYQDALRDGTNHVSKQRAYSRLSSGGYGYHNAPTRMAMNMHMLEAMYGWSDRVTLMLMANYMDMNMDAELHPHGPAAPVPYRMDSSGWGDVELAALFDAGRAAHGRWVGKLGLSLPTGSITKKDDMPHGVLGALVPMRMEYTMQLGSGTYDLRPAITYSEQRDGWSWGAQASAVLRLGENGQDYRLGHRGELTAWAARLWTPAASTSLRLVGSRWGNIHGRDDAIDPDMSPAADPDAQGGERVEVGLGANLYAPSGALKGQRLALEFLTPVYQDLDGPQLANEWTLNVGWQFAF
ncbi:transporter [Immundisolibacter sp.]|uniref:transporter n=1 Tax=Immundisolibacter sp. TaxID=1934948 RepID=UPI003F4F8F06